MEILIWLIFATIADLSLVYFTKKYISDNNNNIYILLALFTYVVLIFSYIKIFNNTEVSSSYTLLQILQILIVVIFGLFFLDEKITLYKISGIITGIASIYLLYQ